MVNISRWYAIYHARLHRNERTTMDLYESEIAILIHRNVFETNIVAGLHIKQIGLTSKVHFVVQYRFNNESSVFYGTSCLFLRDSHTFKYTSIASSLMFFFFWTLSTHNFYNQIKCWYFVCTEWSGFYTMSKSNLVMIISRSIEKKCFCNVTKLLEGSSPCDAQNCFYLFWIIVLKLKLINDLRETNNVLVLSFFILFFFLFVC